MGHGKATADGLSTGLTEVLLQLGSIGHRTSGTVHVPESMAVPQFGSLTRFRESITDRIEQTMKQFDGQARPRFAVGFACDGESGQVGDIITGGIASTTCLRRRVPWLTDQERVCATRISIRDKFVRSPAVREFERLPY